MLTRCLWVALFGSLACVSAGCRTGAVGESLPAWTKSVSYYEDTRPELIYFGGSGEACQTRLLAARAGAEAAYASVAQYVGETVALKWRGSDRPDTFPGGQSVAIVAAELIESAVAEGTVEFTEPVDVYVERVRRRHLGRGVEMYRSHHLYGLEAKALAEIGKAAAPRIAHEMERETDAVRKEQLKKLAGTMSALTEKDFAH
ncbi:MAG: hypothetical protein ACOC8E_02510 [Planctomycetota bacterium]